MAVMLRGTPSHLHQREPDCEVVTWYDHCQHHLCADGFSQTATQVYMAVIATADSDIPHALHPLGPNSASGHGKHWVVSIGTACPSQNM